ncbi:MAG: NADH-ubiquinone oxidoreductase-F iron-sulfur binding region domain-containing protein [Bacillota bacterium]
MVMKERKQWKQSSSEEIKDYIIQVYDREAENLCPVDKLKTFTDNVRRTSCGECVYCREGILQLYVLAEAVSQGAGRDGDLEILNEVSKNLIIGSQCDYGIEVGKIAKSIIEHEEEQFEKHIKRKRCDALVCKKFFSYYVAPEKCSGCNQCLEMCDRKAITGSRGLIHLIDPAVCNRCGKCVSVCESTAIQKAGTLAPKVPTEPVPVGSFKIETENEGGLMSQKRRRRTE